MINVTKTFLPPQNEYQAVLKLAWDTGWMTNRGVLVKKLERQLKDFLNVKNIIATTNGTLPIQIAIKALELKGEIITTPFSYVATTASIVWEGCDPVFVDINPDFLTIDETKIEDAITPKTSAILATHVYGNPCNIEAIEAIATKHNLKVIYDAAHCFGVKYKGKSIFRYGDVSTCSFHATKLFHTGEGGALFCKPKYFKKMYFHHNFGHDGPDIFRSVGINAKMSEPQAAMGISILPYFEQIVSSRKLVVDLYNSELSNADIILLKLGGSVDWNYSYYPVIFNSEKQLVKIKQQLELNKIYPRRYFYPSLNRLPYVKHTTCKVSESIANRVLCLPLSTYLSEREVLNICAIIKQNL